MTRLGTSLPLVRGSCPVRYLMGRFLPWHLPVAALEASRPAIKSAFWDHWETDRSGPKSLTSRLEPKFGKLEASRPAIKNRLELV